jgi:hypothetical protein
MRCEQRQMSTEIRMVYVESSQKAHVFRRGSSHLDAANRRIKEPIDYLIKYN